MKSIENKTHNSTSLNTAVREFAVSKKYFHILELKQAMEAAGVSCNQESIKKSLYRLHKSDTLFRSGRGWYSTIPHPFILDTEPIQKIMAIIREQFPLLDFSTWSTRQLSSYFHHLQTKSLQFVYAERDSLSSLMEVLRQEHVNCYLDPNKRDISRQFYIDELSVVLRPAISEEPKKDSGATIEKILVDLLIETQRISFIDEWEYERLFENIIMQYRIDMAVLIRYARRRKQLNRFQKLVH